MKKIVLLLTALFFVGGATTALADDLLLSLPPIFASKLASQKTCTNDADCSSSRFCCEKSCRNSGVCCNNVYYTTGFCCNNVHYTTGFCCNNVHYTTGFCCDDTHSVDPCFPTVAGAMNDTGITIQVGTTGREDADYGRDATHNDPSDGRAGFSFTKLDASGADLPAAATSWSCVRDNVTGLTWEAPTTYTKKTWTNAQTYATSYTNCGVTADNWRLPTVKELLGIVSFHQMTPSIDTDYFNMPTDTGNYFWTSVPRHGSSTHAWAVRFVGGYSDHAIDKTTSLNVRLVRGPVLTENFVDKGNETIADRTRKLMWKKCPEGLSGNTCGISSATLFTWTNALNVTGAGFAGYNDWRLPNIKELQTIVDEGTSNPAINTTLFPGSSAAPTVWSNSPTANGTDSWYVHFTTDYGAILHSARTETRHVRLVRDCTGTECD